MTARGSTLSAAWLIAKIAFYVVMSMQAADIVVVAYQKF